MSTATTNVGISLSLEGVQQVESGLGRVQAVASDAAKTLAGLAAGTFSAAAFGAWVRGAIDAADETDDLAQKTGLLAKEVAGLKLLFEQEGLGDAFGSTMAKLARQAAEGNKAFAAMGVSVTDASGRLKTTRDLLGEVADQFAGYSDGPEKAALAMELFGKSGADLIPLLNGGAASLNEFDRKAEQLGLTLSAETAAAAAQFNDQLFMLSKNGQGAATALATGLLPALVAVTAELAKGGQQGSVLTSVSNGLATAFEAASVFGINVAYVLKQVGNELGGLAAQAAQVAQFNFSGAAEIGRMMRADAAAARREVDATSDRIINARRRMALGVSSPDDQSDAEARRLGLAGSGRTAAPTLAAQEARAAAASRAAAGLRSSADREAAAAARELAEARRRDLEVVKLRNEAVGQMWAAEQEAAQKAIDAMADLLDLRQQSAASVLEQLEAQRQANAEIGLEGAALVELQNARLLDAAAALERRAVLAQDIDLSGGLSETYRQEAKALRDLASARSEGAQKQVAVDAARTAAGEWQKTSDKIESALTDALMRGFENGKSFGENLGDTVSNYFKTTVAEAIASAITKAIMSALASTQWGQFFSGVLGGGGGMGNIGGSLLSSAAQSYMGGGSALGSSASAAGSYLSGSMSGANAAGSIYANYTGAGLDGLLATNSAYGTASASSAAGASSAGWISVVGYAALIAAAVMVAENLYSKGYNRAAVGVGPGSQQRFGNTTFTSDPNMGRSLQYDISTERLNREVFDFLGMSEKWADILSGTTRMGTLFGRKLGAYGFEADIAGGEATVGGFARYKGGLFRSNKTVDIDVDPRDAEYVKQVTENTIEGSRGMARAMGLNAEAIDAYTGSIRVNMKGAETAEEQAKRMAESMDDLQFSLLKTASGGKLAREEFDKMMEGVRQSIQNAGISTEGITGVLTDGILNGLSGEEIGANLSQMILGGIVQTFAQQAFAPVAQAMMSQIITPIFTAIAAGVPISQAVSKVAITNIVETAKQAMEVMNAIFNSAEMQEFFGSLNEAFAGVGNAAASVRVPNFRPVSVKPINTTAQETAREREQLERELLRLQGNITELRRRELNDLKPSNRALQERIWALEDEREALDKVKELQDVWGDLTDSIEEEIKRLRGLAIGDTAEGLAVLQAQFGIATAQARAMDQEAAGRLPELSGQLADAYLNNATSRSDYQARVNALAASLEETNRITRSTAGINADTTQKVKDEELAQKIDLLQQTMAVLTSRMEENNKAANTTATALGKASAGGAIRIVAA